MAVAPRGHRRRWRATRTISAGQQRSWPTRARDCGRATSEQQANCLSWKCCRFRFRPQLVLTTWFRVFLTRRPDTADVSATSCDVGFFFSVLYFVSLPNCRHVVVVTTTTYHTHPVSDLLHPSSSSQHTITIIVLPTSLPPLLLFFHSGSNDDSPRSKNHQWYCWCRCLGNVIKY
jgi:hypothetical protein